MFFHCDTCQLHLDRLANTLETRQNHFSETQNHKNKNLYSPVSVVCDSIKMLYPEKETVNVSCVSKVSAILKCLLRSPRTLALFGLLHIPHMS